MMYSDFIETCGIGNPRGITGINCRHSFFFVTEEMPAVYSDEQLAEMHEQATVKKEWVFMNRKGKKETRQYNQYDASQKMRQMENNMRKTRSRAAAFKAAEDKGLYIKQKEKYMKQRAEYKRFCEAMTFFKDKDGNPTGFRPQFERVTLDGLGKI